METQTRNLTNLQQELLKLFSYDLPKDRLEEIKHILAQYFAGNLKKESAKVWEEKGYSNELMDEWLNEENQ